MDDDAMSRQEAEEWIAKHPLQNQAKFWRKAETLGPSSVPGMIAVLADGPAEYHMPAALILSRNDIEVSRGGDDPASDWVLTFANGDRQTIEPRHWIEPDSDYSPWGESGTPLDAAAMRKLLLTYTAMFVVAAILAVGAYAAHGIVQVFLAILAGVIFAVALWSTVFMTLVRMFQKWVQRAFPDA